MRGMQIKSVDMGRTNHRSWQLLEMMRSKRSQTAIFTVDLSGYPFNNASASVEEIKRLQRKQSHKNLEIKLFF